MRGGKRTVKWLDAKFAGVLFETSGTHQRNSAEASHVGVVQSSTVIEVESHRRIVELVALKMSVVDQESAREARLHHDSITGVQIEHHQLSSTPAADNGGVANAPGERARIHLPQYVALPYRDLRDPPPANRA